LFVQPKLAQDEQPGHGLMRAGAVRGPRPPAKPCAHQTGAEIVVAIAGRIVVAIRRPAILRGVVPTAAAIDPVRA
jgi:hypothetical protein